MTVPLHPQRIVSLHDLDITIPLIELGVPPVASHGRTRPDGSHFLRASAQLTGVDFDNSAIRFIGTADIDLEAVAAAKPDLIITEAQPPRFGGADGEDCANGQHRPPAGQRAAHLPQAGAAHRYPAAALKSSNAAIRRR
ncbi:iron compound-binding protein of ABC transporter family [Klebsiella michiganensis]|uniref:Iron compound-binding protein of ABC transporter family n=1 Tax=Klebsiella michiganensis TaxID=1134687 RepID=A0A7H4PLB3_9ENTR|nr:iron compound-binding protein of ABC transporter family [Klebsiella michiganensis]